MVPFGAFHCAFRCIPQPLALFQPAFSLPLGGYPASRGLLSLSASLWLPLLLAGSCCLPVLLLLVPFAGPFCWRLSLHPMASSSLSQPLGSCHCFSQAPLHPPAASRCLLVPPPLMDSMTGPATVSSLVSPLILSLIKALKGDSQVVVSESNSCVAATQP